MNYYNEFDPKAAAWLRELINQKLIPDGHLDTRSICDVQPADLTGYTQCHFFCGIAGWPLALQIAKVDPDEPLWTGSCPCQPFSVAGLGKGTSDTRHLWPQFFRLIRECRPPTVFGEQVASKAGRDWLAGVFADLQRSLASRLHQRLAATGSQEYLLTWRAWDMPSREPICALRALAHRTSGSGFTGWPTPDTNQRGGAQSPEKRKAGGHSVTLQDAATTTVAGWGTPNCMDHLPSGNLENRRKKGGCCNLKDQVALAGWSTPTTPRKNDSDLSAFRWNPNKKQDDPVMQILGRSDPLSSVPMEKRGALNPEFSRWLMGYPAAWGSSGATAMQSFPRSRRSS